MTEIFKRYAGMLANRTGAALPRLHPIAPRQARQRRRRGLTAIEYCFMLSLVMLAVLLAVQHVGASLKASFEASDSKLQTYMPPQ